MTTDHVNIKDFTITQKTVSFKIDDDIFEAIAVLGLTQMQDVIVTAGSINELTHAGDTDAILRVFDSILTEGSAKRFRERAMSKDHNDALDVRRQLIPILQYLLEEYGVRPTQPSLDSSSG